ncbi:hypothetical protein, partial [Burkholderia vietnamiensis]|uniref:hypothetical protein n=1 Tax=Burkholderia vietnamiensis TaxID=60552 RepID=UPI001E2B9110
RKKSAAGMATKSQLFLSFIRAYASNPCAFKAAAPPRGSARCAASKVTMLNASRLFASVRICAIHFLMLIVPTPCLV